MDWIVCSGDGFLGRCQRKGPPVFPDLGYSIKPLEVKTAEGTKPQVMQHLFMFVPAEQGFAGNVGVQVQPYPGTLKAYAELSSKQFAQMKVKVIKSEVQESHAFFEYSMLNAQKQPMHVYSKAFKRGDLVYLVSATTLEKTWAKQGPALKECVDSFSFLPPAK